MGLRKSPLQRLALPASQELEEDSQGLLHQTNFSFPRLGQLIRLSEDKKLFK